MVIPDANVLLYAVNEDADNHAEAKAWLDGALSRQEAVGFVWVVLLAFIRISTRAGIFSRPLSTDEAMNVIDSWLAQPSAVVLNPTSRHPSVLRGLLNGGTAGNLVTDGRAPRQWRPGLLRMQRLRPFPKCPVAAAMRDCTASRTRPRDR